MSPLTPGSSRPSTQRRRTSSSSRPWTACSRNTPSSSSVPAPCRRTTSSKLSTSAPLKVLHRGTGPLLPVEGRYKADTHKGLVLTAKHTQNYLPLNALRISACREPLISKRAPSVASNQIRGVSGKPSDFPRRQSGMGNLECQRSVIDSHGYFKTKLMSTSWVAVQLSQ